MKKENLTVGIGGGGINIINNLFTRELIDSDFLAIDTDLQNLEPSIAGEKILLGERGLGFNSLGYDLYEHLEKLKQTLTEKVSDYSKVAVISCLGGNTDSKVVPNVLSLLNELSVPAFVVCTFPFHYEGKRKKDLATICLNELEKMNQEKYLLKNDDLLDLNSYYTVEDIFDIQNEEIARKINNFIFGLTDMEEKYAKVFGYEPDIEESAKKFSPEFDAELDRRLQKLLDSDDE